MLPSAVQPLVEKLDPWFYDGSIVLSCEGVARFRVHAGVLARHSEVFRNMFADAVVPPVSDSFPIVEGCPIIELSDETADIHNLMSALYGPINFKMKNVEGFLHLSSILRMATKYCIDWLRDMAANYLCKFWPNTLQGWMNLICSPEYDGVDKPIHPALVINLARKVDFPSFLPIALYRLGRMSTKEAHEADLTSATGPIPKASYCLSREDVLNHIRYKERASLSAQLFVQDFLEVFEPDFICEFDVDPCLKTVGELSSNVRSEYLNFDGGAIGFMDIALEKQLSLCPPCRGRLEKAVGERRQALWDELPSWFGLPNWEVLMADFAKEEDF